MGININHSFEIKGISINLVSRYALYFIKVLFVLLSLFSCTERDDDSGGQDITDSSFISGVDISSFPEISATDPIYFDSNNEQKEFLDILRENGVNTVRLRLWVDPLDEHSSFNEVRDFSQELKQAGFKTLISLHYSDTWADPAHQKLPAQWENLSFEALKDQVGVYTRMVATELEPDYIQIGNEINSGFLYPHGNLIYNPDQCIELLGAGVAAVRSASPDTKIIIHHAGISGADWFYDQVEDIDYDIIGLSYYPIWHGKSLENLSTTMQSLIIAHDKDVMIAETAYPFTLAWNDFTNNIVGLEEQLILPEYPATEAGQRDFIRELKSITRDLDRGIGFCYWGAELIAWYGEQSEEGSPWENQALFDFDNQALPVLSEFKE